MMNRFLVCLLLATPLLPELAHAAGGDLDGDLDSSGKSKRGSATGKTTVATKDEVVREINRGLYAKASLGATTYLLNYGNAGLPGGYPPIMSSGTALSLAVGDDFVDSDRKSISWEVGFEQGVHSGLPWGGDAAVAQAGLVPPNRATEGDVRTFIGLASIEYSVYPSRRIGVGLRAGAGVLYSPLLMNKQFYEQIVVPSFGYELTVHKTPHPLGFAGPTFEYYTKLSHFSVGADVDVLYALTWDLGVDAKGYLKYTF